MMPNLPEQQLVTDIAETFAFLRRITESQPKQFYIEVHPLFFVAGMLWQCRENELGQYLHSIDTEPEDEDVSYPPYPEARDAKYLREHGYVEYL